MDFTTENHLIFDQIAEAWTTGSIMRLGSGHDATEILYRMADGINDGSFDHAELLLARRGREPLAVTREMLAERKPNGNLKIPRDEFYLRCWIRPLRISKHDFRQWVEPRYGLPRFWFGDEESPLATTPNDQTVSPIGRPSKKIKITEAYKHLSDNGQIDVKKPQSAVLNSIRQHITGDTEHKQGDGLCDEAIRKHIAPLFRQDRDAH